MTKFFATAVPRSVRAARLAHLPANAIIGTYSLQAANGAHQAFDLIMQIEADFLRTRNYLAAPTMNTSLQQGAVNSPYVLRDVKQIEMPDGDPEGADKAKAHFRKEFKLP